jgi:hypothetical protein
LETRIDTDWDKLDNAACEKARASASVLRKQRTQAAKWYSSLKKVLLMLGDI